MITKPIHLPQLIIILSLILQPKGVISPNLMNSITLGTTERVSVAIDGAQANSGSWDDSISADGRFVAFVSVATNLVSGNANSYDDVYVHDRQTGANERVSVASNGTLGNGNSDWPSISADGRFVAFVSRASNLVSGDTNSQDDVFVHDRLTGATERVSVAADGTQGNYSSHFPSISTDGHFVAFESSASNLVSGDTNGAEDVFIHDRLTGATERVSVASDGTQGNDNITGNASISADGRFVAFDSYSSNLVSGDNNKTADVFIHDRLTGATERVSVASDGTQGNGWSGDSSVSADGRFVAFSSSASNLVSGDTNSQDDVFVHDRLTGTTERVSVASDGTQGNGVSFWPSISADGRFVTFHGLASNLVNGDTNNNYDVFVHDRLTGATERVSVASDSTQGNAWAENPSISADGRFVAFDSTASNLVSGDTNGAEDVFVRDRGISTATYSISGVVKDGSGTLIPEVTISDGGSHFTTTGNDGTYTLSGFQPGSYTITASLNSYSFTPISIQVVVTNANLVNQNFTGTQSGKKPWLLIFYVAGDNSLSDYASGVLGYLQKHVKQPNYNMAVLFDGKPNNDSLVYYISDKATPMVWNNQNELNSGDFNNLTGFVEWARNQSPSDHTALILIDHGNTTLLMEDDSQDRTMKIIELGNALQSITNQGGKIDVLFLDACLMATTELGDEVQGSVDYLVASQNEMWMSQPDFIDKIIDTTLPKDLAIQIADSYNNYINQNKLPGTISVAQLSAYPALYNKINSLATLLESQVINSGSPLIQQSILSQVQRFDSNSPPDKEDCTIDSGDESLDLYDFARLIQSNSNDLSLIFSAQDVMKAIQDDANPDNRYIIKNYSVSGKIPPNNSCSGFSFDLHNSHGVSIFFPKLDFTRSFYVGTNLSFAAGTVWNTSSNSSLFFKVNSVGTSNQWGPMLVDFIHTTYPNASDDPNPPTPIGLLENLYIKICLPNVYR